MSPDIEDLLRQAIQPKWKKWANLAELYLYATLGGWLAHLINFPAAWLIGSLFAVAIALFCGRPLVLPKRLQDIGIVLIGIVLGSGFTPETLEAIATWPLSLAILAATVVAISWAAYIVLRHVGGWDHSTALFASLPGALAYVMAIAEEAKADMTRVTIAQSVRLFVLIAVLPVMLSPFSSDAEAPAGAPMAHGTQGLGIEALPAPLESLSLVWLLAGAAILVPVTTYFKVPAGLLLSGMIASGGLYLSGVYAQPLPDWFMIFGFVTMGAMIGSRFGSIRLTTLLQLSGISLLSLLAAVTVACLASLLCATLLGFPFGQVFLAYSPGGFEAMVLLSFLFDLNPAYVAGHHLVRYLGLVLFAPIITAWLTAKAPQTPDADPD